MKITAKCYYALIASVELAGSYGKGPVRAARIAEIHGIPVRFLELILNDLKSAEIVESKRGVDGGFSLKSLPAEIRVYDIFKAIDGELIMIDCEKVSAGECMLKEYMHGLRAVIYDYLHNTTLAELAESCRNGGNGLNYVI
ncbi:RrF2 family transcriptional regulator [Seleniivibrio woodruffii]|uniref:RrF2 family transcriptional regulator n=1 Tax=Seleniivibrio woodruffii TaxID=1078050 RepID=UPI0024093E8B|nr:Rrf2 family transcriptional regulator [Seleniivibrio woodruffii]